MSEPPAAPQPETEIETEAEVPVAEDTVTDDQLLVEEVSIDGMCGVY